MALRFPPRPGLIGRALAVAASTWCAAALTGLATMSPALAQTDFFRFEQRPSKPKAAQTTSARGDKQMMVQATEVQYDHVNERVNAVGNVQIYYDGSTIEADKVTYNQKTKRLRAEGNVRLTEASGNITYGDILELNDDYRDGFVRFCCGWKRRMPPASRRRASTAAKAAIPCCKAASIPRAKPVKTIRKSPRSGRSRARASFTTNKRR